MYYSKGTIFYSSVIFSDNFLKHNFKVDKFVSGINWTILCQGLRNTKVVGECSIDHQILKVVGIAKPFFRINMTFTEYRID